MATFHENLKTSFARFRAKYVGYTTCSTAAATAAKTASLTNFALATGSQVKVKFTYANTASAPTLNINSTGAKSIKAYGTTAATVWWSAGDVVSFTYDGTNWIMEATNGQIHSLNSSFSSALTALKNTAIAQAVGATGSTFTAVIDQLATIVNRGAVSQTLNTSTTSYTVPAGYHNGSGKVSITTETKTQAPGTSAIDVTPSSGKVLSKVTVSAMPLPDVATKWQDNTLNIVEGWLGARGACADGVIRSVFEIPQGKYYGGRSARDLIGITDDKMSALGFRTYIYKKDVWGYAPGTISVAVGDVIVVASRGAGSISVSCTNSTFLTNMNSEIYAWRADATSVTVTSSGSAYVLLLSMG